MIPTIIIFLWITLTIKILTSSSWEVITSLPRIYFFLIPTKQFTKWFSWTEIDENDNFIWEHQRKFFLNFCFEGCNQPWLFFIFLLCCSSFVQKEKEKTNSPHISFFMECIYAYEKEYYLLLLIMVYVKSYARIFSCVCSSSIYCWVRSFNELFLSGMFDISSLYSLTNLHHALQHNFMFMELATRDTIFEDRGCGREDYYMNASLDQLEQNTQLIHNWYKYIFQR